MFSRSASIFPSRLAPSSNERIEARPWCIATMFSLRVSVHRTGLPVARAIHPTITSSTAMPLAPKPPPTSGATTRTFSGSRPSRPPSTILSWWGVCELIHSVNRPSSPHCAALDLGSIGHAARRWLMTLPLTTTSLESNRFGSGFSGGFLRAVLVPTAGNSSTSSRAASSGSVTAGSGS